jgi:hypothetical protein
VKLEETVSGDVSIPYFALSYCWGGERTDVFGVLIG